MLAYINVLGSGSSTSLKSNEKININNPKWAPFWQRASASQIIVLLSSLSQCVVPAIMMSPL